MRSVVVALRTVARLPFQEIADNCQLSVSTAKGIVQRAQKKAQIHGGKPFDPINVTDALRSGRPPVITDRDKRRLIHTATKSKRNRLKNYEELQQEAGLTSVSLSLIQKVMKQAGYSKYAPNYKPLLNKT